MYLACPLRQAELFREKFLTNIHYRILMKWHARSVNSARTSPCDLATACGILRHRTRSLVFRQADITLIEETHDAGRDR